MKFIISSNVENLRTAKPDATVEAEYGDAVAEGLVLTMAHHGPRAGQKAPCAYENGCGAGVETIGLSHVDLDTIGGCLALLGQKPSAPSFWALAEFVDLNGPHKLGSSGASSVDLRRLNAYWAFSQANKVFAPRDGSVADVTAQVMKHVDAVNAILGGNEVMLRAGDRFAEGEDVLNRESFVSFADGIIVRQSKRFVNHLYVAPDGRVARAVVTHNPSESDLSGGAVTLSLADPIPGVNCGEILKSCFGPEAGGHAGIGGSPRGKPLPMTEALRVVSTLASLIVPEKGA